MHRSSTSSSLKRRVLKLERKQRKEVREAFSGLPLDSADLTDGHGARQHYTASTLMMSRSMERGWCITETMKSEVGSARPFLSGK